MRNFLEKEKLNKINKFGDGTKCLSEAGYSIIYSEKYRLGDVENEFIKMAILFSPSIVYNLLKINKQSNGYFNDIHENMRIRNNELEINSNLYNIYISEDEIEMYTNENKLIIMINGKKWLKDIIGR